MLNTENILSMSNEELYSLYLEALEQKNLNILNVVRSVIADRYCIKELKKSHIDEPFKNPLISRFFTVNKL